MKPRLRPVLAALVATTALLAASFSPCAALEIKRVTLSNGATLLVSEQHQLPMVTAALEFDAGSRRDPKGKEGLAALTADCLTEGTKELSAEQLNQKIDFMGSSLNVSAGEDYAIASFTSLKRYEDATLHLLAGVLTSPALKDSDITRKRAEHVAGLKAAEEQPGYVAQRTFVKQLFGEQPYGHLPDGTVESVEKLKADDVRSFYRRFYRSGGAIIAVVGDVSADEVKTKLETELAALKGTAPAESEVAAPVVAAGPHVDKIDRNVTQANVVLGFAGVARSNPDYYRLQVANYIFGGGGFSSRLMKEVRSKAGLAYSIHSAMEPAKYAGSYTVVLQTKNSSANEAIKMVLAQMRELQDKPVSDAELEGARKFLVGSFPLKLDRQSSIANFLVQVEFYGLGLDYAEKYPQLISAVTREDVQKVAREHLHPDKFILVVVADQKQANLDLDHVEAH